MYNYVRAYAHAVLHVLVDETTCIRVHVYMCT